MIAIIFLCVMKSHLFAMFVWNFTTTSLSIAEILFFFIKKMGRSNVDKGFASTERLRFKEIIGWISKQSMVSNFVEMTAEVSWGQRSGATWITNHLCGSESVAYSSVSLRACWWRALWTSVVTAALTAYRYLSFELIPTVFIVLETCVFSVSSRR